MKVTPAELAAMCRQLDETLNRVEQDITFADVQPLVTQLVLDATSARNLLVRVRDEGLAPRETCFQQTTGGPCLRDRPCWIHDAKKGEGS